MQVSHHTEWDIIMQTVKAAFLQQTEKSHLRMYRVRVEVKNLAIMNNGQKVYNITS
jgi:hypothetical protein